MNLTQLESLKSRLKLLEADVVDDELLGGFIAAIGARFEIECNRRFERTAAATYVFRADEMDIVVDRYPIESISRFELKDNETDGWAEQTDVFYLIGPQRNIIELNAALGTSRQLARVTFDGGYVLPGGTAAPGQTALPEDIEEAVLQQCVWLYQNKDRIGQQSQSGQGGAVSLGEIDLVPALQAAVKKYERYRM